VLAEALQGGAQGGSAMPIGSGTEALTGGIAPYNTYLTKDGQAVALAALEPKFWAAFCAGVGLAPDMTALVPGPHQAALKAELAEIFRGRTREEWVAFASTRDCCLEPVLHPREVAGDAAELFDPHDPAAIAAGLDRVLGDRARRVELVVRGTEQAARFSWEATARGTADVYREVLAS